MNQLRNAPLLNSFITDIAVYGENGNFASLFGPSDNYETFAHILSGSRFSYRSAGTAVINGISCHILAMPVYSLGTGESHYLGILFLAMDVNRLLSNTITDENNHYLTEILLADGDGRLVYGSAKLYEAISAALTDETPDGIFPVKESSSLR